ncbi:uncharacterized protein BcabD6B2_45190 [Babesia caballi]|uniref:Uncharacterized protein n=1 Tax=Babesia caballi TaxID=5871 RepID=A0AAV4M2N3_BABCB|nr:hypothetical protein, conserved [Babesia caballi]
MGHDESVHCNTNNSSTVMAKVGDAVTELQTAALLTKNYPEFFKKLKENGKRDLPNSAMNAPLYALYAASYHYLKTALPYKQFNELPKHYDEITSTFQDLKDARDWLALVGGGFGGSAQKGWTLGKHKELGTAFKSNPEFSEAKTQALGGIEPSGVINKLADKLGRGFLGYEAQGGGFNFSGSGIIKNDQGYTSKYKDATWNSSDQDKYITQIFLGAAVITYFGLSYLYWRCDKGGWSDWNLNGNGSALIIFMSVAGFTSGELNSMQGSQVAGILTRDPNGFDELKNADKEQYSYPAFILSLETHGPQRGINSPLTNCYVLAKEYYKSKFKKGEPDDQTLTSIKAALDIFKSSCRSSASDLYEQIGSYISTYMPDPSSSQSNDTSSQSSSPSSAGPIAGTLSTVGLGGGAAAAYFFDIGGTKTLINGLLRIG